MARQRKNASFTLDKTYGSGHGDRSLIQAFYRKLNELCPGDTPIPIPPESQIHPQHDEETQSFIFADYAVRKFAPIALRVAKEDEHADMLAYCYAVKNDAAAESAALKAGKVSGDITGRYVFEPTAAARAATRTAGESASEACSAAIYAGSRMNNRAAFGAARAAVAAAKLNPDATWAAVNEMLQAL